MDHVCNAVLENTPTEATFPVLLARMDVVSVLGPTTAFPRSAAIVRLTMVI